MPNRVLREGILTSRAVGSLSESALLFYYALISLVDDFGRVEADLEVLRIRCFPRRMDSWTVIRLTDAIHETATCLTDDGQPLVTHYQAGAKRYLQINNFQQRIRAEKSKCPSPDGQPTVTCQSDDGPPRASRAQGRTESKTYSESNAEAQANAESGGGAPFVCAPNPVVQMPQPKPRAADQVDAASQAFEQFWERYPRKQRRDLACGQWISVVTAQTEGAVFACLARYLASDEVARGVLANPDKWLYEQHRNGWAGDWPRAPTPATRKTRQQEQADEWRNA